MSDPAYKHIGSPVIRLVEECGELLKAIGKGERFGWNNHHPERTDDNLQELRAEWRDLNEAYDTFVSSIYTQKLQREKKT